MADQKPIAQQIRDRMEAHADFWRSKREAMNQREGFLAGDRYEDDHGAYNRDRRLIQIRGQETQDTIRHICAKATEKPRSIEARPVDRDADPDAAEVEVALIEQELGNPWKGFEDAYENAIQAARELGLGVVWLDWHPECNKFGELIYSWEDPRRICWDPAYDPHHPLCAWLNRERRIPVEEAREKYKAPWLQPDRAFGADTRQHRSGTPLLRGGHLHRLAQSYDDDKVTIWEHWLKNDKSEGRSRERDGALDKDDRYLLCMSGCDYRSPTQGDLKAQKKIAGELPEMLESMCPTCGGNLERIDALPQTEHLLAYDKGHRLVVVAPFSSAPDPAEEVLEDGDWPLKLRSFPGLFLTAYARGNDPVPECDVDLMWDQQIASDQLRTMALQRVFEHRSYWEIPKVGLEDARGQRFGFREDQFNIMYRDATNIQNFGPEPVRLHQGTGLDPQFMAAFNITQQALTQYRGMNDLGPIEERSKAKSGVALQTENAIGEVPVAHFNRRKNRALAKWYGIVSDAIHATYTPARLARLNIEGADIVASLWGDQLPNFDFVIEDTPDFTGLEQARSEAFSGMMQAYQQALASGLDPLGVIEVYAEVNNLPRSIRRKMEKLLAARAMMPGLPGAGAVPPQEPGTDALGGLGMDAAMEAAGMVPEAAG
jgi:hypothetical protein